MFSQTTEYALRAMACLALQPDELVATPALASRTKVPSNYLSKVLQLLAAEELIIGRRGVGGGYRLARPAAEVTLLEVINAVTPVARIETCPLGLAIHGPHLCSLHRRLDDAAKSIIDTFDGVTLQDLLDDAAMNRPLCNVPVAAELTVSMSGCERAGQGIVSSE